MKYFLSSINYNYYNYTVVVITLVTDGVLHIPDADLQLSKLKMQNIHLHIRSLIFKKMTDCETSSRQVAE